MGKLITFGKLNNYYKYIGFSIIFKMINELLYGINYNTLDEIKIISTDKQKLFSKHLLVHQMVNYMGTILISFLCDIYYSRQQKINGKDKATPSEENRSHTSSSHIILIHNSNAEEEILRDDLTKPVLIIIFLWIFESHLLELFILCLKDLDFWMLELLIITYLSANMFKLQIFKHQKLAIYLIFFPCLLKICTIILSFFEEKEAILYVKKILWIPIGILIYLILISIRSYVYSKIKWFMDLKYISSTKLLFFYGILGSIICLVSCIITTFVKCKSTENNNKVKKEDDILDFICLVNDNITDSTGQNETELYFDSFKLYFKKFSRDLDILYEIIILISGIVTFFLSNYFAIQVIKYLTPVYLIFSNPIFFFIQKTILAVYNEIKNHTLFSDPYYGIKNAKFYLDLSGDTFSIIALLIYLEIVELNFNEYNYNLRKTIIKRSLIDSGEIVNQEEELDEEADLISS